MIEITTTRLRTPKVIIPNLNNNMLVRIVPIKSILNNMNNFEKYFITCKNININMKIFVSKTHDLLLL
jgi:hypothetical protein